MRQRDLLEFRTPQHPSSTLGANNWGGDSPLLARKVPKESLEQKYLRLNTIRTRDEIFPAEDEDDNDSSYLPNKSAASKQECPPTPSRGRRGYLLKLLFAPKKKAALGSNSKKSWFPRWEVGFDFISCMAEVGRENLGVETMHAYLMFNRKSGVKTSMPII